MTYAEGGTISYANGKRIHTFTDSGTLVVTEAGTVEALVVAGGGAGGGDYGNSGTAFGGGGGGGVIYTAALAVGLGNIAVTVGEGGISAQSAGGSITDAQNSVITDGNVNFTTQTAIRGGTSGQNGGSGGGGGGIGNTGGTGTVGQGNDGGDVTNFFTGAAGGGGAGVPGWPAPAVDFTDEAGAGGNGIASSISGETRYYGAGGGGGAWQYGNGGGGLGGGGNGAKIGTGARDGEFYGAGGGGQGASVGTGGRGHKGVVIFSYDSAFTTGRRVAENEDLADMAASTIKGRITTTGIPQDLTSTQVAGILASHFQPLDSDLTSIAGLSPANDDIIQRKAGVWTNRTLAQYKTDIHLDNINVDTIMTDSKDPTGWVDPTNVNVSYDSTARTITLTPVSGTLQYYWRGVKVDLGATWTSSAHDAADGGYYLYSSDGTNITWSTTVWTFDMLMVAKAIKSTTPAYAFAIKETHGLMPWEAHQELHDAISTYRTSGGTLTAGTYTENTATDAANTPGFDVAVIKDEDNSVTIPAWTQGTYTTLRIGASSKATFDTTATLPFRSSGSYILINNPTTGGETASTNNKYVNVYQVLIPATVDAGSQSYRMVMMQPQRDHPSLADAQLENPQNLSFGDLTSTTPEFVIYARITYALAAGDGNTGKARIATGGITYITGSRLAQTSSSGISNHEDLSGLLGGATDEHYHLTSAEYTGTGSGVFTRTTSPTLVAPVISNFFYANHTHAASGVTGGTLASATGLPLTTGVTGILPAANGGTGINNSTRTLTISTNAGTIDFSAAASTLTVPATGQALVATVGATTVGRIPYYSTTTGSVTSTANFAFDGSKLAIGTATPDASYRATLEGAGLLVNFSTNALFDAFTLRNLNTGTSAGVRAGITTDAGTLYFEAFSDAYTTTNWQGKSGLLATSGLNGIFIASPTTIQFDSSNTAVSAFVFDVTKGKALFTAFSTTGADTVLELDQSDASEEYINFISDAVTANYPVDTATAVGTAYARLRVAVNGTFKYIQLYNA